MEASERAGDRRTSRKQAARKRAERRRRQRMAVTASLIIVVVVAAGGLTAWWLMGRGGDEASAQALSSFDTTDYHSLAFHPDDQNTVYFGHHGGLKVSEDGGETWRDGDLQGVDVMQQSVPTDGNGRHYAAGHEVFFVSTDGGQTWTAPETDLPALDIHGFAAAPTDSNRLYAFEIVSRGFYTSSDGGSTWETLSLPAGMQPGLLPLAVGYDDPLHVFAADGNLLIESTDGGKNWTSATGPGPAIISLATIPDERGTILAGTADGLWKGSANGRWTPLGLRPVGSVLAVAVHPENPDRVVALDQQGNFYRSDDGGAIWGQE